VSDAMLPVDQVRSQAPLAPRTEGEGSKRGRDDEAAEDGAGSSEAAEQPAGEPDAAEAPAAASTPSAE